jgi:hypothetical protein
MFKRGAVRNESVGEKARGDFPQVTPNKRSGIFAVIGGIEAGTKPSELA